MHLFFLTLVGKKIDHLMDAQRREIQWHVKGRERSIFGISL